MRPTVSLVTINYNSKEDTLAFLNALFFSKADSDINFEVIVVDNNSDEDPTEAIKSLYPEVFVLKSKTNTGFAGGNNLGISKSQGDYVFIVNNDAIVSINALELLISQYEKNPSYGILCPLIKNPDDSIQFAGYTRLNTLTGRNKTILKTNSNSEIIDTAYPHGAAMLISRKNLEKVGLMTENYFLYYEELDWGEAFRRNNLKVGVSQISSIKHKESSSVNKISELKLYFVTRNRILFVRKNFHHINQFIFAVFFFTISVPFNLLKFWVKKEKHNIQTFIAGIKWHFQHNESSKVLGYKFNHLLR